MFKDWIIWAFSTENKWSWLFIAVVAMFITFIIKGVLKFISRRLRKFVTRTKFSWDKIAVDLFDGLKSITVFIWLFSALTKFYHPNATATHRYIHVVLVVITVFQLIYWSRYVVDRWRAIILKKKIHDDPSSAAALGLLYISVQSLVVVIFVLMGLNEVGINIGALLAGLGVGGIAVALAAQNILGDLLASLSIVLDKPFVVGDFIVAGNELGTIEYIGIKTTRVKSLSGEEIVFSNKDLLESRIHNYRLMSSRRVVQKFGVTYFTPEDTLEQIPIWVKDIVTKQDKLKFDRCHLAAFGASSFDYELVFFVNDSDYNIYMDLQQKVLANIVRKFNENNVEFAFPTRTLYVEKLPPIEAPRTISPTAKDSGNKTTSTI